MRTRIGAIGLIVATLLAAPTGAIADGRHDADAVASAPTNDAFDKARKVPGLPFDESVDMTEATLEPGEPAPSCAAATASVWYRFSFPHETSVRVQTSDSDVDTVVAIYRGEDLVGLTESACNDTFVGYVGGPGRVLFTARAGATYHVQALSKDVGTLRIALDAVPKPATVAKKLPFEIVGEGGIPLRGHVYVPEGPGPFATVLEYSPYWNTFYIATDDATVQQEDRTSLWTWLGPYLDAGYAVALVNMRGSGISEGCAQWGSRVDARDAAAVIETLAAQPWSNGKVGMIGVSFPAWMQYLAVSATPPALKAVVPVSGVIDFHSLVTRNGAPLIGGLLTPSLFTFGFLRGALAPVGTLEYGGRPFVPQNSPSQLNCPRYVDDEIEALGTYEHGDRNKYWEERDLRGAIAGTKVAVFAANGMNPNGEGHVLQFEGLWDLIPKDRRLLLGQWGHDFPLRDDFADQTLAWFDHYLRGGPRAVERDVVEFQDTSGAWNTARSWPPNSKDVRLYLSDRTLVERPKDVVASTQTFPSRDADPYAEACPDRALYVSPPVAEDVLLAGNADVRLTVTSDLPDGNLSAFVWHVDDVVPCGEASADAFHVLDETVYPNEVTRALTDLRHRDRSGYGSPFPAGPTSFSIHGHPFATLVRAGERLVLGVGGSYILMPEFRKPVLTITTGERTDGWISLPVVEGNLRFRDEM